MTDDIADENDWSTPVTLSGRYVRLEPMTAAHTEGLLAIADDDVFEHLSSPRPQDIQAARRMVETMTNGNVTGGRVCWAQIDIRDTTAGPIAGTTSYYEINPANGSVAIGFTWLGRQWWRSGLNTEAKLLLLQRAFDVLGAVRVFWHTDIRNIRSQAAIAGLGAEREGLLRKHKRRPDGSWRDTVQFAMTDDDWPAVRDRLTKKLYSGVPRPAPDVAR
ncbi:GNAT family N-acetyltransferase [Nocardia barduliensis]|uniref:GNAT family N-acetyltransferase n=1 Tax=Nocardia barduliensis TaxID=2736643 RepID=UPI001573C721|nr:GNAT family protein [Nocardia barduliensis]